MPTLQIHSLNLHYLAEGTGQPVFLLHGLGSSSNDWLFQMPEFTRHFRVIAPDFRGHGQSSLITSPITISTLAADIAALMDALQLSIAHIVGLSLGGMVAQQLAIDFPQRVDRLVLANTFAHLWPTRLPEYYTLLRRAIVSMLLPMHVTASVVASDLFPRPDQAELRQAVTERVGDNELRSYRSFIKAIRTFDTRRQLQRIQAPTLILTGERDNVVPRGCQRQLVEGIPHAQWQLVADSGHATPIDQPAEFNRLVLNFLLAE
jgi:3-oxoadipate enol-lactonase